jgi:hypothetical protein
MFSTQSQKKARQNRQARSGQKPGQRIYSIAAWPEQRAFAGTLSFGSTDCKFSYMPSRADVVNKSLQLIGRLKVTDARGRARALNSVRATLANTQGGVGTGPLRRQMIASDAPIGDQITSQQKQQVAGETEKQAGEKQAEQARARGSLPATENTGPGSYCGVLYFHFEPLDAGALGVTADLTKVQLNVRLEPLDETARTLHGLYCDVVDALYGERADEKLAAAVISELNRVFAG